MGVSNIPTAIRVDSTNVVSESQNSYLSLCKLTDVFYPIATIVR